MEPTEAAVAAGAAGEGWRSSSCTGHPSEALASMWAAAVAVGAASCDVTRSERKPRCGRKAATSVWGGGWRARGQESWSRCCGLAAAKAASAGAHWSFMQPASRPNALQHGNTKARGSWQASNSLQKCSPWKGGLLLLPTVPTAHFGCPTLPSCAAAPFLLPQAPLPRRPRHRAPDVESGTAAALLRACQPC